MSKEKNCAIVIPIYENDLNIIAKTSLDSLCKNSSNYTIENYPIFLIGPYKLEPQIEFIKNYIQDKSDFNVNYLLFDDSYFENTATYSHLLKEYSFYKYFENYDYILIYQTDCIMIHDDLKSWISKGYDYVGAPILVNSGGWKYSPIVGNGGCSLRKIKFFLEVTDPNGKFLRLYKESLDKEVSARGKSGYEDFEDLYFAELISYYNGMKKPRYDDALKFAFDMNPDIAWTLKNEPGKLPSFIHAFDKNLRWYDKYTDIKKDIKDYEILYKYCEEKHKKLHEYYLVDENNPSSLLK